MKRRRKRKTKTPGCVYCNKPVHGRANDCIQLVHGTRVHSGCMGVMVILLETHMQSERKRTGRRPYLATRLEPGQCLEVFGFNPGPETN